MNVRLILDANTIIYLIKANLFNRFMELAPLPIVTDSSVYKEVVEDGIANNYPDAYVAKKFLNDYKIPIHLADINDFMLLFRDPGETSCYILAKDSGICITSDRKAILKYIKNNISAIQLDEFFYEITKNGELTLNDFKNILKELIKVYATTQKRMDKFIEMLHKENKGEKHE